MKSVLLCVLLLLFCGSLVESAENKTVAAYDIFNLRWGMNRDECYKICDWGGKFKGKRWKNGSPVLQFQFNDEFMVAVLSFNEHNRLCEVRLARPYDNIWLQFECAEEFYFYLDSILRKKYILVNSGVKRIYRDMHPDVRFGEFLKGKLSFSSEYESANTKITLSMLSPHLSPSLSPSHGNARKKDTILVLSYEAKKAADLKCSKDSVGL